MEVETALLGVSYFYFVFCNSLKVLLLFRREDVIMFINRRHYLADNNIQFMGPRITFLSD